GRLGNIGAALRDTWYVSKNTERNKAIIEQNLGRFAFDTGLMMVGGVGGALLGNKARLWEEMKVGCPQSVVDRASLMTRLRVTKQNDGTYLTRISGNELKVKPDGSSIESCLDRDGRYIGISQTNLPDGTRITSIGGNTITDKPDGTAIFEAWDGFRKAKLPNGDVISRWPSGREVTTFGEFGPRYESRQRVTKEPDGTLVTEFRWG